MQSLDKIALEVLDALHEGCQVIEARSAAEALLSSERYTAPIDLLLTDVIMPELSGPELAKLLLPARPDMLEAPAAAQVVE